METHNQVLWLKKKYYFRFLVLFIFSIFFSISFDILIMVLSNHHRGEHCLSLRSKLVTFEWQVLRAPIFRAVEQGTGHSLLHPGSFMKWAIWRSRCFSGRIRYLFKFTNRRYLDEWQTWLCQLPMFINISMKCQEKIRTVIL